MAPEWSRIDPSPNSVASNAQDLGGFSPRVALRFLWGKKTHTVKPGSFEVDGKMGLQYKKFI